MNSSLSRASDERRIRVLWVIKVLGPGGAEQLLLSAARVHDHDRFDLECAFMIEDDPSFVADVEHAGVPCHLVTEGRWGPFWPLRLRQLIATGGFDVVHVHSPLPGSVARLAARSVRPSRRPETLTTEHCNRQSYHPLTRGVNRLTSRLDAATVAVSDETLASITGPTRSRAETLAHGIDLDAVRAHRSARADVREELGVSCDDIVVGTVSNFRKQKDYPNLLRAIGRAAAQDPRITCVSVGHGPLETEMASLAERLGVSDRIQFLGRRRDATRLMSGFDVFTLASRWEGLPVAMMEALSLGLPIVATRVGGVGEALGEEPLVRLVPPDDHIALSDAFNEVAADPKLRCEMASRSEELADRFDIRRTVAHLEGIYERLVDGPAR